MSPDDVGLLAKDLILGTLDRSLAAANDGSSEESPADRFAGQVDEILNSVGLTIIACRRE